MRAALLYQDKKGLFVEKITLPELGPKDVLLEVQACGVCGTDVHLFEKHIPISLPKVAPGHEISAVIKNMGSDVRSWKINDEVILFPQIFCGGCYACKSGSEELCVKPKIFGIDVHGGFSEQMVVPERVLMKAPLKREETERALFAESIGVAYHALFARGNIRSSERVLVMGIGGLGTSALKLLKAKGCEIYGVDNSPLALERAKKIGVKAVATSEEAKGLVMDLTHGEGVDATVDFVGKAESVKLGYRLLKKGGRLILVGVGQEKPDFGSIIAMAASGKSVIPSFGFSMQSARELLEFVSTHQLSFKDCVTETFPLDGALMAIEKLKNSKGESVRYLIQPNFKKR